MEQKYIWNIEPRMTAQQYNAMSRFGGLLAKLLFVRGAKTEKEGMSILKDSGLKYDPFLMKNMDKTVSAIKKAIKKNKKITIYGDYDADGVTASAILIKAIRTIGGDVDSYIPDRFAEGYGLNCDALKKIKENGAGLVVSVDCGIRSVEEAEYARKINLPLIITDHHEPGEILPEPKVLLSPKQPGDEYPDKNLAGCGIALKIAQALTLKAEKGEKRIDMEELIMIATVGTVADLVPLKDENRSLVKRGIELFRLKNCRFVNAMSKKNDFDPRAMNGTLISFTIAPRINAAGRISHASTALNLILAENDEKALEYASEIEKMNSERKLLTQQIQESAEERIKEEGLPSVICIKDEAFQMGVVGLAAAKLVEKYNRPAFVGSTDGNEIRISGRSVNGFDMIGSMDRIPDVFVKYGGHEKAAGATVLEEKWDEFVKEINEIANENPGFLDMKPVLNAELLLPSDLITLKLFESVSLLEPYGEENPVPLFEIDGLKVEGRFIVGQDKSHLKLTLSDCRGQIINAIAFGSAWRADELPKYIDVICSIDKNSWNGNDSVQLQIKDMRTSMVKPSIKR